MAPSDIRRKVTGEVEALTGSAVHVRQDATVRTMAALEMARGPVRIHQIRIHPNFQAEADYLTCLECGFIVLAMGQRAIVKCR